MAAPSRSTRRRRAGPASPSPFPSHEPASASWGLSGMSRVLVIEDELPMRRALEIALSAHGYEVEVVENGAAGLNAALSHRPDLVILDLGLPDIDGVDVARRLRSGSAVAII